MKIPVVSRTAVKIHIEPNDEFNKYIQFLLGLQNRFSQKIHELLASKRITEINQFSIIFDGQEVTDSHIRELDWAVQIAKEFGLEEDTVKKTEFRSLYWEVFRRYRSYLQRNKELTDTKKIPKRPIDIRNKSINLKEKLIMLMEDGDTVEFIYPIKGHARVSVKTDKSKSNLKNYSKLKFEKSKLSIGGVINLRKHELVVTVDLTREYNIPSKMIGFDINKRDANFLVFSEFISGQQIFPKPEEIAQMEEVLKKINEQIHEKGINSNTRGYRRIKWRKQHGRLNRKLRTFLFQILDQIDFKDTGLAIDTPCTGQTNGSFGQDKIKILCSEYCRSKSIFFYFIPTPYTSQRCSACGLIEKSNRKEEKYSCACGYKEHSDVNGAKNIKTFGDYLLRINHPMSTSINRDYKIKTLVKLKTEYGFRRNPVTSATG